MFITKKNKNCLRRVVPSIQVSQPVVKEAAVEKVVVNDEVVAEEQKEIKKKNTKNKKEASEEPVEINNEKENS